VPKLFLFLVLAAGLSACASTATESSAEGGETTAKAEGEKPRMRCYREKNTGFRLGGERVCEPIDE